MAHIRAMREEDVDDVRDIDAAAFGAWWRQTSGQSTPLPPRTRPNVLACRDADPGGAFVAEEEGQIIGFIFSRTWGSVGWFGPLAVLPWQQGRGIGQQLVAASLAYLRQKPGRMVGLETMAESAYNLGLYLRQGFRATLPTFRLGKSLPGPPPDHGLALWSAASVEAQSRWLAELGQATGRIQPGLAYGKEIVTTARHGLGDTVILCDGERAIGFSTVHVAGSREGADDGPAVVQALALHPDYSGDGALAALLDASEVLAWAHGKQALGVPANGRHGWAIEQLLARGYRVARVMIRMVVEEGVSWQTPERSVELSRWAG